MGKKSRNLAGLAALGALGYFLTRKQDGTKATVEDRGRETMPTKSAEPIDYGPDYAREVSRSRIGVGEVTPAAAPASPVKAADLYRDLKDVDEAPGSNYARAMYERDVRERGRDKSVVPMTKRQPTKKTYERKMGATAEDIAAYRNREVNPPAMTPAFTLKKKGGAVRAQPKKMASGGMTKVSSASSRGDGIAQRGKTKYRLY
jgi:hypothetical protein